MAWQEFATETTEDLIEYIRWINIPGDKQTAEDAFRAFCFRLGPELQKTCRVICGNRGYDNSVADEIAEITFGRFLKYPRYDQKKCKSGETDKCVLLYLFKIAKRVLSDYVSAQKKPPNPFTGDEEIVTEFWDIEAMDIPSERKAILLKEYEIIKTALERLGPKHKIIYLTYKEYEAELNAGFNLPRSLLKRLQDELCITQASIRVYKKEANEKIKEYLTLYGKK